jgi:hypothetical protein
MNLTREPSNTIKIILLINNKEQISNSKCGKEEKGDYIWFIVYQGTNAVDYSNGAKDRIRSVIIQAQINQSRICRIGRKVDTGNPRCKFFAAWHVCLSAAFTGMP